MTGSRSATNAATTLTLNPHPTPHPHPSPHPHQAIYQSGYTRIPVYQDRKDRIVGVVFAKDLVLVDPNDEIPVASILPFCSRALHHVPPHTNLEKIMSQMQSTRSHLFFVSEERQARRNANQVSACVGIVTMEDVIEELISDEIVDESDTVQDNISRRVVQEQRAPLRIEFFEMLQRKELMLISQACIPHTILGADAHLAGMHTTYHIRS